MASTSRLGNQLKEAIASFERISAPFALIGGLALATHKVVRATQDVDLLTDGRHAEAIEQALIKLGYLCRHRSIDAGNYLRGDERLNLLYATRPLACRLLAGAPEVDTAFGKLHVINAEGLIALNADPGAPLDQPLVGSGGMQSRPTVQGDPYMALDDLMVVIEQLCPVWPPRELFKSAGLWLL
jgi:hypothetical protein